MNCPHCRAAGQSPGFCAVCCAEIAGDVTPVAAVSIEPAAIVLPPVKATVETVAVPRQPWEYATCPYCGIAGQPLSEPCACGRTMPATHAECDMILAPTPVAPSRSPGGSHTDANEWDAFVADMPGAKALVGDPKKLGLAIEAWRASKATQPVAAPVKRDLPKQDAPEPIQAVLETWRSEWMYGITRGGTFFYLCTARIGKDAGRDVLAYKGAVRIIGPRHCSESAMVAALVSVGWTLRRRVREYETASACRAGGPIGYGFLPPLFPGETESTYHESRAGHLPG